MTIDVEDHIQLSDLLADIPFECHTEILNRGGRVYHTSGDMLIFHGDPALRCYFVVRGRLKP